MEFQSLCIRQERTVQQALRQLNQTAKKILFVINGENMLLAAQTSPLRTPRFLPEIWSTAASCFGADYSTFSCGCCSAASAPS